MSARRTPLVLGPGLALPPAAITEVVAWLGRRGQGKTYAALKFAEQLAALGSWFIALDPVGVWWGLRLAADGKAPGLKLPVFGGMHGDLPLHPTGGKLVADVLVERRLSAVLDVSQFESDTDKARFVHDFGARFYYLQKRKPAAVHLFLEEAQEFVPQNPMADETRMLHVYQRLAKLGRNFGIGLSLISQRPQEVHKKVLNLAEILFAFQLTGPHERKAVEGWIADHGSDRAIADELPKLTRGHPRLWSPALLKEARVVEIGARWTFDASATPEVGKARATRELAPIDLEQLRAAMAETIERTKAEDPKELRRQLALRDRRIRELEQRPAVAAEPKRVEVPVLANGVLDRLGDVVGGVQTASIRLVEAAGALTTAVQPIVDELGRIGRADKRTHPFTPKVKVHRERIPAAPRTPLEAVVHRVDREILGDLPTLPKGERAVLTAIAQHPDGVDREQLTVLTGYKRSSRDTYLRRLSANGLIETHGGRLVATEDGRDTLGPAFEPLPTGSALREHWLRELPEGERRILEVLIGAYPSCILRSELDTPTGYKRSSRDTYIRRLAARHLVLVDGAQVLAAEELFDA